MTGRLGAISFVRLVTADEIGVQGGSDSQLINAYLDWAEAYAEYWLQMKNGVVLLQMIPDDPASGAIYLLNSLNRTFYLVEFTKGDTNLTRKQFEELVYEYKLLTYASYPQLIETPVQELARA